MGLRKAVAEKSFTFESTKAIAETLDAGRMGIVAFDDGSPAGEATHKLGKAPFVALVVAAFYFL